MLLLSLMWLLTSSCSIFVSKQSCTAGKPPRFPATASPLTTFKWKAQLLTGNCLTHVPPS